MRTLNCQSIVLLLLRCTQDVFSAVELLPMLLLGVIGGLLGSCFNHLNSLLSATRRVRLASQGPRGRLIEALAVAALTSVVSFAVPMLVMCQVGVVLRKAARGLWTRGLFAGSLTHSLTHLLTYYLCCYINAV